jgi:hypothetical protein
MAKQKPAHKVPSWHSRLIPDDNAKVRAYNKKKAAEKARKEAWKKSVLKAKTGVTRFIDKHVRGQQGPKAPTVKSHTRNMSEQAKSRTKAIQKRNAQKAKWAKANRPGPKHWSSPKAPKLPKPAAAAKLLKIRADKKKAPDKKPVQAKKVEVKATKPTPSRQPVRKAVSSSSGIKSKGVRDYGSKEKNLDAWAKANPQLAKDLARREAEKKKRRESNSGFKSSATSKSSPKTKPAKTKERAYQPPNAGAGNGVPRISSATPRPKAKPKPTVKPRLYSGGTGRNRNRNA